ncbi:MAG: hypothetical protein QOG15_1641 [Solirubrobacteraceae bacterium]|jgi:hypothetical protein|nr:hypothetical protein [Solirubrobacteraceae bacterium]
MTSARWWEHSRWALPFIVIVPMLALANVAGTHAIIFPEGAALAMGVWVLGLPGWTASRWRVLVLPPLCAAAGVALVDADVPRWAAEIAGVTFGLLVLQAFDSRLAPALSAVVLPIVFGIDEWSYPLAVLVVCAAIAALWGLIHHPAARRLDDVLPERYPWPVAAASWLVVVVWILVAGRLLELSAVVLAPPLFVSALEWLGRGDLRVSDGARRGALLTGAGLAGSLAAELVSAAWVAGTLAVCVTLALMWLLATPHPPALAIAIIPQILGAPDAWRYTTSIAAGAGALYLGVFAAAQAYSRTRGRRRTS